MRSTDQRSQGVSGSAAFSNKELCLFEPLSGLADGENGAEQQFSNRSGGQHLEGAYLNHRGFQPLGRPPTSTQAMR